VQQQQKQRQRQQWQHLPTQAQLVSAGRFDLLYALKHHGYEAVRQHMGLQGRYSRAKQKVRGVDIGGAREEGGVVEVVSLLLLGWWLPSLTAGLNALTFRCLLCGPPGCPTASIGPQMPS